MIAYTCRQLLDVSRWVKEHPTGTLKVDWCTTLTAAEWTRWFRTCLDRKINRALPVPTGRKHAQEWQIECQRAARQLNTPRLIIRWLPRDLRRRCGHRLLTDC
jgi:hypothetical protein